MVLLDVVSFVKATGHFIAAEMSETTKIYWEIWALKLMKMHRMSSGILNSLTLAVVGRLH